MFCCMKVDPIPDKKPPLIVDLHEVVCDKAWINFRENLGLLQKRCLKREHFIIEVPDNFFVFEKESQWDNFRVPGGISASPNGKNNGDTGGKGKTFLDGRGLTKQELTSPEYVSLDTQFRNDTAEAQTYNFKFTKQRKTTINVSFQRGFTLRGKANFSLNVPALGGSAGVETSMHYQVTKTEGETFEDTMTMEATSNISVGPTSCYTANIQLDEKTLMADFEVIMRMTMPQGRAPVYIKRKKDGVLIFVYNVENLPDTFDKLVSSECARPVKKEDSKHDRPDLMDFIVTGVVKGSLACNHKIQLTSDESEELKEQAHSRHFHEGDDTV